MKKLLGRLLGHDDLGAAPDAPALAVAQLLIEIARADLRVQDGELGVVREHLMQAYGLSEGQLDGLLTQAARAVDASTSLYETVQQLNRRFGPEQKAGLIRALWQVAYADQRLDAYEEALLRRMADLLYVPHEVFIREKLRLLDD